MKKTNRVKIAIQKNGRLTEPSLNLLSSLGLQFKIKKRDLITSCCNYDVDILYVRNHDIPEYVRYGAADFGIVGENVIYERNNSLPIIKRLGFGTCSLVIAVPCNSSIKHINDLEGERIATSYPYSLKRFLEKNGVKCAIVSIQGSVEIAPELNLADAICDITKTGKTLKEYNLIPLVTILKSEAVLVESTNNKQKKDYIKNILINS